MSSSLDILRLDTMPARLRRSLVEYWPLEDAANGTRKGLKSVDLAEGGTTAQITGPSNNLRLGAGFVTADTDYLSVASNSSIQNTGPYSFSVWIRPDSDHFGYVIGKDEADHRNLCWGVRADAANLRIQLEHAGNIVVAHTTGSYDITADGATWSHLVVTWDRQWAQIYLNGSRVINAATSTAPGASTQPFNVGRRAFAANEQYFNGGIAHLGFWRRVLTASEIFWLYNNGAGRNLARGC